MSRTACSGSAVESTIMALRPPVSATKGMMGPLRSASARLSHFAVARDPVKATPARRESRSTAALEKKIESHLQKSLGYAVATFIRTPAEVTTIAGYEPFPKHKTNPEHTVYVGFMAEAPEKKSQANLIAAATPVDEFHVNGREVYWLCRVAKFSETQFSGGRLEKILGRATTLRNSTTVRKLAAKYPSSA